MKTITNTPVNMTEWSMKLVDEKAASILSAPASHSTLEDIQAAMQWNAMRTEMLSSETKWNIDSQTMREKILCEKMETVLSEPKPQQMTMLETPVNGIIGYSQSDATGQKSPKPQKNRIKYHRKPSPVKNPNPFEASLLKHKELSNRWIALAYQGIAPVAKNFKRYQGMPFTGHAAMMVRGIKRPSLAGMLNVVYYGGRSGAEFMNTALENGGEEFLRGLSIKSGRKPSNTTESIYRDIPYGTSQGWIFVKSLGAKNSEERFNAVMMHLRGLIAGYLGTR